MMWNQFLNIMFEFYETICECFTVGEARYWYKNILFIFMKGSLDKVLLDIISLEWAVMMHGYVNDIY